MTDLERLPHVMRNIADDITPADAQALAARVHGAAGTTRRRVNGKPFIAGLAAAAATAAVLAGTGVLDLGDNPQAPTAQREAATGSFSDDSIPLQIEPGTPCVGATKVDVERATAMSKTPMWAPAKGPGLAAAWTCAGELPAFTYGETTLFLEPGWGGIDVKTKFAGLAEEAGGYVDTIDGAPALIQPANEPGTKPQVLMVRGDTLIRLLGVEGGQIDEATTLAESMRPGPPER